jgi:ABC-2 type transport system ATP-binding protein
MTTTTPAIACRGLSHRYGQTQAVADLDLEVRAGEAFGLLGPNGAGKTTTIRALVTLVPLQAGEVSVFGHSVRRRRMLVRRLIGYVPQQLSADATLTGRENVALFARLYDVPRAARRDRVAEVLAAMGLSEAADRLASTYSGGMIRRLELRRRWSTGRGCWSSTNPRWGWTRSPGRWCGSGWPSCGPGTGRRCCSPPTTWPRRTRCATGSG